MLQCLPVCYFCDLSEDPEELSLFSPYYLYEKTEISRAGTQSKVFLVQILFSFHYQEVKTFLNWHFGPRSWIPKDAWLLQVFTPSDNGNHLLIMVMNYWATERFRLLFSTLPIYRCKQLQYMHYFYPHFKNEETEAGKQFAPNHTSLEVKSRFQTQVDLLSLWSMCFA